MPGDTGRAAVAQEIVGVGGVIGKYTECAFTRD